MTTMTLNRQSNLLSWIAAGAAVVVLTIVGLSAVEVQDQTAQITSAENTAIGITNLRYLVMETALYRERRSADQWNNRVLSFRSILDDSRYTSARENALLAKERANLEVMTRLYEKLRAIDMAMPLGASEKNPNEKRTLSVLSALFLTTQDMLDDAFELVRLNRQELIDSQDQAAHVMLISILLLYGLIVIAVLILKKKVLAPISTFQAVVDQVTLGDLAARVELDSADEIGQLGVSFDNMTERLEASHDALRAENTERLHAQADLKKTIDALALARDEAEGASRAKSQFLANISHEIRTPMNAVLGMLQLLHNTELTALQKDYAGNTQAAARSLLGLLNDILDFSKIEAEKLALEEAPFSVEQLLRDLSVILAGSIGDKNVELLFIVDPALPAFVTGDMHRLRQVLLNLISNAIKFTECGEVTVALNPALAPAVPGQVAIRFAVTDTGIGIPADKLDTIFEGFTQAEASTTRRFGGTGLGLAISQRLVALMGGALGVESRLDEGSHFHFTVVFHDAVVAPAADMRTEAVLQQGQLRVLIVDDHAGSREVLLALVGRFGWQAHSAATGVEALALIERSVDDGSPYNAVLVDWKMPQMDGWEVARRIRQLPRGDTAPVIIMVTAHERNALA
ncbi:MAG: response regulator, partial [Herminiimonas sp.]|nr:response regulator [Herminiimonas sp.]